MPLVFFFLAVLCASSWERRRIEYLRGLLLGRETET